MTCFVPVLNRELKYFNSTRRYLTFFYYLNEPEEGGETAFVIAGNGTVNPKVTV